MTSPFRLTEITAMCLRTMAELSTYIKSAKAGLFKDDAIKEMDILKHKAMNPQDVVDKMGWTNERG